MNTTPNQALPGDMLPGITCCFTGHRVLPADRADAIADKLRHAIRILSSSGFRYFICGGALGFDMLAEKILLGEAEKDKNIHLVLALPCRDQTQRWLGPGVQELNALREYMKIKAAATTVYYIKDFYEVGCMKERNQFMVDKSSFCVAYYNGSVRSGSGQTVRMAQKAGLKIYNIAEAIV